MRRVKYVGEKGTNGPRRTLPSSRQAHSLCRQGLTLIEVIIFLVLISSVSAIAIPLFLFNIESAEHTKVFADLHMLDRQIHLYQILNESFPNSLADIGQEDIQDPYGNPYEYLNIADGEGPPGQRRKDGYLVPLNSDFDLYSKGKDGESDPPLTADVSLDDILRANDGAYFGLASEY